MWSLWYPGCRDAVHFQDFNAEVFQCLTILTLNANLPNNSPTVLVGDTKIRFFAGVKFVIFFHCWMKVRLVRRVVMTSFQWLR
ncbi:hypothetical protein Bca101_059716 [Brassica carinata]